MYVLNGVVYFVCLYSVLFHINFVNLVIYEKKILFDYIQSLIFLVFGFMFNFVKYQLFQQN